MQLTSNDIPLAAKPLDRAAHRRTDRIWLDAAFARPDVLVFLMRDGMPLMEGPAGPAFAPGARPDPTPRSLIWLGPEAKDFLNGAIRLFLGQDKAGTPIFAVCVPDNATLDGTMLAGSGEFEDMRAAAASLSLLEANLVSTARSISEWHRSHAYCATCGSPSEIVDAGWKRVCPACEKEHFPRTDPVAIMLPIRGDHCLMGRGASWPAGFWSCLAGFVEPGETIEQAACREVQEESGVICLPENAEYLFCQPWPFPSSLMMGVLLKAESEEIKIDPNEIADARWFSKDEVKQIMAGEHPDAYCPPKTAIAHHVIMAWLERD
ncbi:MAG: NAD(+) diphosphatase [Ponticaulis sp.]|nr:NAD(+) diphosphatase [Ponticaulis sp.]